MQAVINQVREPAPCRPGQAVHRSHCRCGFGGSTEDYEDIASQRAALLVLAEVHFLHVKSPAAACAAAGGATDTAATTAATAAGTGTTSATEEARTQQILQQRHSMQVAATATTATATATATATGIRAS